VLAIGIWARRQMEGPSALGSAILHAFHESERRKQERGARSNNRLQRSGAGRARR
jgi:hypothetical protein